MNARDRGRADLRHGGDRASSRSRRCSPGSHGTHVASIAAGNRGVARRAHLAGVPVALRPEDALARRASTTRLASRDAVDYLLGLRPSSGARRPLPLSINISLGTNGHAHDTSRRWRAGSTTRWTRGPDAFPPRPATPVRWSPGPRPIGDSAPGGSTPAAAPRDRSAPRPRLGRGRGRRRGPLRDRDGDLVRPAGSLHRRGPAAGRRLDRSGRARPRSCATRARQRHCPQHPQRDLSPGQWREPDLDRSVSPFFGPVAAACRTVRPIAAGEGHRAPHRHGRSATAASTPGSSATTRVPSPVRTAGAGATRRSSGPAVHGRPHDQLARMRRADPCRGQRRHRPRMAHVTSSRGPRATAAPSPTSAPTAPTSSPRAASTGRALDRDDRHSMASPYVCGVAR